MKSLKARNITYTALAAFCSCWRWPTRVEKRGATGKDAFQPAQVKKWFDEGKFKPTASEAQSLYQFVDAHLDGERGKQPADAPPEITCSLLCCDIIDSLLKVARKL